MFFSLTANIDSIGVIIGLSNPPDKIPEGFPRIDVFSVHRFPNRLQRVYLRNAVEIPMLKTLKTPSMPGSLSTSLMWGGPAWW